MDFNALFGSCIADRGWSYDDAATTLKDGDEKDHNVYHVPTFDDAKRVWQAAWSTPPLQVVLWKTEGNRRILLPCPEFMLLNRPLRKTAEGSGAARFAKSVRGRRNCR
jgi:hypothetical protein